MLKEYRIGHNTVLRPCEFIEIERGHFYHNLVEKGLVEIMVITKL